MTVHSSVFTVSSGFLSWPFGGSEWNQMSLYTVLTFMGFLDFVHLMCIHIEREREREGGRGRHAHVHTHTHKHTHTHTHTHPFQHNHCLYFKQMPQWETTTPKFLVNKTVSSAWSHSHRKSLSVRPKKTEFQGTRSGQYCECSNISHSQCSNHIVVIWQCEVLHGHGA